MKLYRITYVDPKESAPRPLRAVWCGTQAEAKAKHRVLVERYERWNVDPAAPVEIPTDKAGLLAWLNENASEKRE